MKNLFKTFVVTVALMVASSVSAGTLYWQVTSETGATFNDAYLIAEDSGGNKTVLDVVQSDGASPSSTQVTQTSLDSLADPDAYLYYVEMCNYTSGSADNDYVVATGYKYGYGDLVTQGYVATGAIDANSAQTAAAAGNMGSAVPEPSSGLLLLMGGAMLALRRRRQK